MRIVGIGTDITEIDRIGKMVERHADHFLQRVYTEAELLYSTKKKQQNQHLAGRWAAKEAVLKALGTGWIAGITWKDVEVLNESGGKPTIVLSGGAKTIADSLSISQIQISISHCDLYAVAYAVALGDDL
ncbi:MAG: holo-ACP synthase [Planctomycetia bacterium]|nr:holo-ACP synthase [Planctomycetia bacterium]